MELLKNFGFDPKLLAAQIINFLIVLWVLKKFLYKPILETLKKRQDIIEKGLRDAKEAEARLQKAEEKQRNILREAQGEAKKIIEDAKRESAELLRATDEAAKQQSEKIIQEAELRITQQTQEAEKKLRANISQIALEFIQKTLGEFFDEKDREKIITKAMKQLERKSN